MSVSKARVGSALVRMVKSPYRLAFPQSWVRVGTPQRNWRLASRWAAPKPPSRFWFRSRLSRWQTIFIKPLKAELQEYLRRDGTVRLPAPHGEGDNSGDVSA